jgi:hypothetical protein
VGGEDDTTVLAVALLFAATLATAPDAAVSLSDASIIAATVGHICCLAPVKQSPGSERQSPLAIFNTPATPTAPPIPLESPVLSFEGGIGGENMVAEGVV